MTLCFHRARILGFVALVALLGWSLQASAEQKDPTFSVANTCEEGEGGSRPCDDSSQCEKEYQFATLCVGATGAGNCEIPCDSNASGAQSLQDCSLGERCVPAVADSMQRYICESQPFRMDLNLLDLCIKHYLDKTSPVFTANECSLERNLNLLLDQNGDKRFDLFDVDLCVLSFLEQRGCATDPATGVLEAQDDHIDDQDCCVTDEDCAIGTYCDESLNICQRDCGFVASREATVEPFERQCMRALTTCDYYRGRCMTLDVTELSCQVDQDCLTGSYCLLGTCTPNCYRAVDCPDSGWFCAKNNKCRAVPPPDADEGFVFEPQNYAIRFARDALSLNDVQTSDATQMAIMDIVSNRQVIGNASVGFGFRMEIEYDLKKDAACLTTFVDCSTNPPEGETEMECWARQNDCIIDPSEQWIRPGAPFGRINAAKIPSLVLSLESSVAASLTSGTYPATVRLIFDNGTSDSIPVTYTKKSPSGEYLGDLTVYKGLVENALNGDRTINFAMRLKVYPEETRQWNQLMAAHQLDEDDDGFVDLTEGQLVHGHLHGESSMAFTRGGAGKNVEDEVHFVGLYSPDQGRLRIVGVIDITADFQIDADGNAACSETSAALCYKNIFNRNIRRRIEFIGPFVPASGRFHGMYRETIKGLVPQDGLTLEGGFILDQMSSDDSALEVEGPIGAPPTPTTVFDFPTVAISGNQLDTLCNATQVAALSDPNLNTAKTNFNTYIANAKHVTAENVGGSTDSCNDGASCPANQVCVLGTCQQNSVIFPNLVEFTKAIEFALGALKPSDFDVTDSEPLDIEADDNEVIQAHLNIYDFLEEWVVPCADSDPSPPPGCIEKEVLKCGLAVYQKAIMDQHVNLSAVATAHPTGVEPDLFCYDTLPTDGCPSEANSASGDFRHLFALQDHNRFWRNLAQILKFEGDRAQSDAFLTLFRNEVNPFAKGAAFSYKYDKLKEAISSYDQVLDITIGDRAAEVLFKWPAKSFKGMGETWLDIMRTVTSDRLAALLELVDLERRIFVTATEDDFRYAHHMMQQEYLIQVYLMVLQQRWEGEDFSYDGGAGPIFVQAQTVVNRLNPVKNELGITSNQIYFENSNPELSNWLNYRNQLLGGFGALDQGGLVNLAQDDVADAVEQMQASLSDVDEFEASLNESRISYADELASICGSAAPWVTAGATPVSGKTFTMANATNLCQAYLEGFDKVDSWITLRDCNLAGNGNPTDTKEVDTNEKGGASWVGWSSTDATNSTLPDCPSGAGYICSTGQGDADWNSDGLTTCTDMVKTFVLTTNNEEGFFDGKGFGEDGGPDYGEGIATQPRCGFEGFPTHMLSIPVQGVQRPCVGGEMGEAFLDYEVVQRNARTSIGSLQTIIKEIQSKLKLLEKKWTSHNDKTAIRVVLSLSEKLAANVKVALQHTIIDPAKRAADAPDCTFIAGFSIGTDCIGNVAKNVVMGIAFTVRLVAHTAMQVLETTSAMLREELLELWEMKGVQTDILHEIETIALQVDPLLDAHNIFHQEAFNAYVKIMNLRNRAIRAGDRYAEDVFTVATHLMGRESGQILKGEAIARDANASFQEILTIAYKMTMAFVHHYNAPPADATNLISNAKQLATLDDVKAFIEKLDKRVIEYCGLEGIDCDSKNNSEITRFSLRDRLFPGLTDVIDARTGKVLTAGEQFHNTITAPPYMKRRFRGAYVVDQIEVPLPLPLTALENGKNGPEWLLDPLACNQKLGGGTTHAVKAIGKNLMNPGEYLNYEFLRGPTDYVRSCTPESMQAEIGTLPVLGYPTRVWTVGYAPQNSNALQEVPPAYTVRSSSFSMCMGEDETGALQKGWEGGTEESNANPGGCWKTFARDRSLASLDQKLIIPVWVDDAATGNHWILGEGLKDDERPLIEDIIVNFRHVSRPVNE